MRKDNTSGKKAIGMAIDMIIIASIFALIVPASIAKEVPTGEVAIYWLEPDESSAHGYCENTTVAVWFNSTVSLFGGDFTVTTDPACGDISLSSYVGNTTFFGNHAVQPPTGPNPSVPGQRLHVRCWTFGWAVHPPGVYHFGNFSVHCNSTDDCITNLNFTPDVPWTYITNTTGDKNTALDNGTFTCGEPTEETYSEDLYKGWNLVSLPLTPSDNSASSVLASVWANVSAVYRYDATSKQFESASTMDPGEGYFVHVTKDCMWEYSGTPYTSMNTELKQGLNMVGWLNCSKSISDTNLSSSSLDYYVARFDATTQKFEVFNPVAPVAFNDFSGMERGVGYFISAKADTTLSESC